MLSILYQGAAQLLEILVVVLFFIILSVAFITVIERAGSMQRWAGPNVVGYRAPSQSFVFIILKVLIIVFSVLTIFSILSFYTNPRGGGNSYSFYQGRNNDLTQ